MFQWLESTRHWMDMVERDFIELQTTDDTKVCMHCFPINSRACSNWGRTCQYHPLCTSWLNPIAHQHQMPIDMMIDFWNPLEEDLREVITL